MGIHYLSGALVLLLALGFSINGDAQSSTTLVPAIITFGDSAVDIGNNDYVPTIFKANYPPYGRDFTNRKPTGRFCNGKLATDITADTLGFTTYPPAYLSPQASGKNLLIGANFASAASGYDDKTAILSHAIPLTQQLEYYKEYQAKLAKIAGSKKAASIIKDGLYIVSFGSSDFIQNYYVNPFLNKVYTPDQYSSYLVTIFSGFIKILPILYDMEVKRHRDFVLEHRAYPWPQAQTQDTPILNISIDQMIDADSNSANPTLPCPSVLVVIRSVLEFGHTSDLHTLGARRIGVTSLPPLGCLPAARTLFGFQQPGCVASINTDAQGFNKKVNSAAASLQKQLPGLKIAIFDIFKPLYDLVKNPSASGFTVASKGCCGTGTVETTTLLCNPKSLGTCPNATQYVFWDSVHPSEAANQVLANSLLIEGINLIG